MLIIRLKRVGKKHQPSYRLVVSERRSKLGGPPVEDLGSYNPFTKTPAFKAERIRYWMGTGAKLTVTVHNLLVKQGIVSGPKMKISMRKAEPKPEVLKDEVPEVLKDEVPEVLKDEVPEVLKDEVPAEEKPAEAAEVTAEQDSKTKAEAVEGGETAPPAEPASA